MKLMIGSSYKITRFLAFSLLLLAMVSCRTTRNTSEQVWGYYTYEHGWSYDTKEGHITASETGTMDFYPDGSAVDSARQEYVIILNNGGKVTCVYNYISPSRWRLDGEDFYFAGIEESFRMEVVEMDPGVYLSEPDRAEELVNTIIQNVRSGIAREVKFHLAKLTERELVWSYTYPDGHTDTWEFYRNEILIR